MITFGRPIIVGVDGGPSDYEGALAYAAAAALRWRVGLRVVHGCEPHSIFPRLDEPGSDLRALREGRQQARIAARRLRDMLPAGREISVSISPGTGSDALIAESRSASLLVLQRRDVSTLKRLSTGSTTSAVAAEAGCPVVVVRAAAAPVATGDIVVGVDYAGHAGAAIAAAFDEAKAWGCGVTAVHAWQWQDAAYDLGFVSPGPDEVRRVEQIQHKRLAEALAEQITAHPEVAVRRLVVGGSVARALVDATVGARLLVVSRHKPTPTPRALGSIARNCISEAHCPVMVVEGVRADQPSVADPVRAAVEW